MLSSHIITYQSRAAIHTHAELHPESVLYGVFSIASGEKEAPGRQAPEGRNQMMASFLELIIVLITNYSKIYLFKASYIYFTDSMG